MKKLELSLLDLGYRDNRDSLSTLSDIIAYGSTAEELNFKRIWLAEHHDGNSLHPYTNPEILMTLLAGSTSTIRVGSAGSLIGYYPPYLLASNYKLMNNIFDDRIDFGFSKGRPANSHQHDYFKLRNESHYELFCNNLNSICEIYQNEQANFEEKEIVIPPFSGAIPSLWYLSNSYKDMPLAIEKKLNYCRSLIHGLNTLGVNYEKEKVAEFKSSFFAANGYYPEVTIALAVSFTLTKEEIQKQESEAVNQQEAFTVIPVTIESLHELLHEFQDLYGVDEFVIYDTELNNETRINNLMSMQEKFQLATIEHGLPV